jgi:hypothetical protein
MEKYKKILSATKERNPFLRAIQLGYSPDEVKETIVGLFDPYFDNKDILKKLAIPLLVPDSVQLLHLKKRSKLFFKMFEKCIFMYHLAKNKNPQASFKVCAFWQPEINQSLSNYWSIWYLERDKASLEIDEFLHESLRNIGEIIESLIKPFLKVLLCQAMIIEGSVYTLVEINSLDLGKIIEKLIKKTKLTRLFEPPPQNIKLNQWRNIAYHHQAKIENNKIILWYGKASKKKFFKLSKIKLLKVVHTISIIFSAIKLAHAIYVVDNSEEISKYSSPAKIREEALFLDFISALSSQGFEVIHYSRNPKKAKIIVKDVTNLNPNERRIHSSQFLFPLWKITRSKKVIVEYREKNGKINFMSSTNSIDCQKIYNGKLNPLALAEICELIDLKENIIIPKRKIK